MSIHGIRRPPNEDRPKEVVARESTPWLMIWFHFIRRSYPLGADANPTEAAIAACTRMRISQ